MTIQKDTRTRRIVSLTKRVETFVKKIDDLELYRLGIFLGAEFLNSPPNDVQQEFIREFFGEGSWAEFITIEKKLLESTSYFPPLSIDIGFEETRGLLAFEINKRLLDVLKEKSDLASEVAKKDLKFVTIELDLAVALIPEKGEEFNKVDGFSNIYEVLVKHELIKNNYKS